MQESVERAFREEWSRAVAILTRALGDLELAEDAVQDAFAMALERWPRVGEPRNPGAWIVTTSCNRAIDRLRRDRVFQRKVELLARLEQTRAELERLTQADDADLPAASAKFACLHRRTSSFMVRCGF